MAESTSLAPQSKYDVFLSYRGEDVRRTFVDRLHAALSQKRIKIFKDDDDDKEELHPILKAIEESRCAIVVFSKSYASSSWCLDELLKIMECSNKSGLHVLPVYYYNFNPSNLRRQGSAFGELFSKYDLEKVSAWTSALVEAANFGGIGLIDYRYQATRIHEIGEIVFSKLNFDKLSYNHNTTEKKHDTLKETTTTSTRDKLVGIERQVQRVKELLKVKTRELTQVKTASNSALAAYSPQSSTYNVFMCFNGNDTCKDFADQLYSALKEQEFYVFNNNQGLASDESIQSRHLKEIEVSSIAVVIFSKNYASASCCLDELVKIIKCNEKFDQIVLPVFYDVDPSYVRNTKGAFEQIFKRNKPEKVETWRKALIKAVSFPGWHLNGTSTSDEATFIKNIVDEISRSLVCLPACVDDNLIGMEVRMENVISLLELDSEDVRMLGIWGMAGIGKTTTARAVYDQVSSYFDVSLFVENIREVSKYHGLVHIQEQILSRLFDNKLHIRNVNEGTILIKNSFVYRKVLIVLDDVNHNSQLEALAGDCSWFGSGSRIIIATRDENVLVAHNITLIYCVRALDDSESYLFLRRHAFKNDDLMDGYQDLLAQVVSYAAGLPLVLKVLSSLLRGRSKKEWVSVLARLQVYPEKEIEDTLMKSYDELNAAEKEVFLYVACFFNGYQKGYVVHILDSLGFSGDSMIRLLEQKSLVSISKGHISMHKLIKQMGRDIVCKEHPDEPGKRSRVWDAEDVSGIFLDNMGTKEIDAMVVDDAYDQDAVYMSKAFRSMKKLRLLQIHSHDKSRALQGSNYLPKDLRWLTWRNYPLSSLPSSFKGSKLVGLELRGSSISALWGDNKFLGTLCFLDLSYSLNLIKTPDFTGTPNLKELKLECCIRLIEVHESIGGLCRLSLLRLRGCKKLKFLPRSISQLKSLKLLDVRDCSNLQAVSFFSPVIEATTTSGTIPPFSGQRPSLKTLNLSSNLPLVLKNPVIKAAPTSVGFLSDLVEVKISTPLLNTMKLPKSFPSLRTIELMGTYSFHDSAVQCSVLDLPSDDGLLSESETWQELVECEKEKIPLLRWKGV